jgi:aerobic C4-dicarboxylate transport protein
VGVVVPAGYSINLDGTAIYLTMASLFVAEAWAATNFSGNAVATLLVGSWNKTVNMDKVNEALSGRDPFDEVTMLDDG